jgi:hypothetical protein
MGTMRVRVVPFVQKLRVGRETPPVISRSSLQEKGGVSCDNIATKAFI